MAGTGGNEGGARRRAKWKRVAYGGMQAGYDDNYTDDSFLEEMVMNANVVKRDLPKVMADSVSISQYLCVVALVVSVWTYTLNSAIDEAALLVLDAALLALGFLVLSLAKPSSSSSSELLLKYLLNISFFIGGLYVLAPVYHTLTRSISSDSIWALAAALLLVHLFLHDYSGASAAAAEAEAAAEAPPPSSNLKLAGNISLNASIVASVLVASRLPSRLHVFAILLFSLQAFLFAPLVASCVRRYSAGLHFGFSSALAGAALCVAHRLHRLFFALLLALLVFVSVVCPYWLIRIQEYKFEINGPWDEAKLCFDISE